MHYLDAVITHIVSELTGRFIPIDGLPVISNDHLIPGISLSEWSAYLKYHANDTAKLWRKPLKEHLNGKYDLILQELDHMYQKWEMNYRYLSICQAEYPYLLRQIKSPPWGLFVKGSIDLLTRPSIAVVGARKASFDALQQARILSQSLARDGALIVSGGAIGCDAAAHLGALNLGFEPAPTAVVFAGGLDDLYPRRNHILFRDIAETGGLFLTERLFGSRAQPFHFPIRNRIIAGISNRVILIQAAEKSGAMNTVRTALDFGRDVMVFDGDNDDIRFSGNRQLQFAGAPYFKSSDDYMNMNWEQC
ncbi:MAG: DNA-protecting protein DprA [Pseudobacteriovorax sp.]|nr:DNA-protecting protein DprA [Pseudobacteriovorax sp.]